MIDLRKYNKVVGKKVRNTYKGHMLTYELIMEIRRLEKEVKKL